jgi:quercetin dioxygenase-like cupin family protein
MRGRAQALILFLVAVGCRGARRNSINAPDLPSSEGHGLANKLKCSGLNCLHEQGIPPADHGPAHLVVWETDFDPGSTAVFSRVAGVDVLGIVLSGPITLTPDEAGEKHSPLGPWTAFVAPGAGVTLAAAGPARAVLAVVTSHEPVSKIASLVGWESRPQPIVTKDLAAQRDLAWANGACHARIAFDGETSRYASLGVLSMAPGIPVPPHSHEQEWEYMAILQGDGNFIEGDAAPTHLTDGASVGVPPKTRHEWRPGSGPFLGIQFYTPPGPEQRFKKLAAP